MDLMGQFDEAQETLKGPGFTSWYHRMSPQMTDEQVKALDAALQTPRYTASAIAKVLQDWGFKVNREQVARYRRQFLDGFDKRKAG